MRGQDGQACPSRCWRVSSWWMRAPVHAAEQRHVGTARALCPGQRLVLPVSLVGRGAQRRHVGAQRRARVRAGVVVLDLVVVPHHQPGAGGVRILQRGVAPVLGVAGPVLVERAQQPALVQARRHRRRRVFVDVVAEKGHQVQVLGGQVAPGGIVAMVPALAAGDRQAQRRSGIGRRGGARAADPALLAQRAKAVPVPAPGCQARGLGVHAVRPAAVSVLAAARGDAREGLVMGQLPLHRHLRRQVVAGQPRPQHQAVGARLAAGDAEGEAGFVGSAGVADEGRGGEQRGGTQPVSAAHRRRGVRPVQDRGGADARRRR